MSLFKKIKKSQHRKPNAIAQRQDVRKTTVNVSGKDKFASRVVNANSARITNTLQEKLIEA